MTTVEQLDEEEQALLERAMQGAFDKALGLPPNTYAPVRGYAKTPNPHTYKVQAMAPIPITIKAAGPGGGGGSTIAPTGGQGGAATPRAAAPFGTKDHVINAIQRAAEEALPASQFLHMVVRDNPNVPVGNVRVTVEFPGNAQGVRMARDAWRDGNRDVATTRALYAEGVIEPFIPWEGGCISWRVTDYGKSCGVK